MVGRRRTSNVSANRRVRMKDGAGVVLLSSVRLERIEGPSAVETGAWHVVGPQMSNWPADPSRDSVCSRPGLSDVNIKKIKKKIAPSVVDKLKVLCLTGIPSEHRA